MLAEVRYRGYGPTYHATYNTLYGEYTTGEPFKCRGRKSFRIDTIFCQAISLMGLRRNALLPMVAQSPYYMCIIMSC